MDKNDTISILYVEDQDDVRLFLSKILSRHYSKVYLAENGKTGLEMYHKHKPDIIISDIKMPVMDGLSMSSRIKETDPRAKIILTTAHSDMEYFIQSIEIGINQYILKPIDREKLYAAINSCKDQVMLEREVENQNQKLRKTNEILTLHERDLRESLQKAIALKEIIAKSEENFRNVAENIQDAFWLRDNKRILFVNKAFEMLFELPSSHLFDNPKIFTEFIHEDDKETFKSNLAQHELKQSGCFDAEFKIITSSGIVKNIWYRDIFIVSENESDIRRLSTLSDISWKIENERLHQGLILAEKSAQVKQRILANVSHEMRTPLNGVMAMAEFLSNTNLAPEQADYVNTIIKSGEDLLEITSNLLDISELEHSGIQISEQEIDTKDLFLPLLETFKKSAIEKGLGFRSEFKTGFPEKFISDPKRIIQLIRHLLVNALKFTPKGEISISFEFNVINDGQSNISIQVNDTGIGIKPDYLDKVFQLFSQEEQSDSRRFEGLGLGLTICNRIATILKGHIVVKSKVGKGSSFRFTFPVSKITAIQRQSFVSVPQLNLSILCVEDKEVNQKILTIMMENAGCTVDIAPNGLEALKMYELKTYDVILMDIQMPLMDGITATQELRKRHKKLPPIIGVSANALRADAQHYIAQGLDDYISKPVVPAILYGKIQQWLGITDNSNHINPKQESISNVPASSDYSLLPDLDMETLETLREQTHNDEKIIIDLYSTFIQESDVLLSKINQSIMENENAILKDSTHALKGLSATIGALKVYHIASEMDKLHKQKNFEESESLFDILTMEYNKVKSLIYEKVIKSS
jgi:PAS domain S-box-containing protein